MKIAVVGNYNWPHYQQTLLDGLRDVAECSMAFPIRLEYFPLWNLVGIFRNTLSLYRSVMAQRPDMVFLYRVDWLFPLVLGILKRRIGTRIFIYHNDDPYYPSLKRRLKHHLFLKSLKYSDLVYVYRTVNLSEAKSFGARRVKLLRSYYYTKLDLQGDGVTAISKKVPRIVFIGHFESDERVKYLDALFKAGINVQVYGHDTWRTVFVKNSWPLSHLSPPVYNQDYRKVLGESYAALAFFSKKNRDDYTRRCFEIPVCGTLLFAPSTEYMKSLFTSGENAVLFSDHNDIVSKAREILQAPRNTNRISRKGYCYIKEGGFSEKCAAETIVRDLERLNNEV